MYYRNRGQQELNPGPQYYEPTQLSTRPPPRPILQMMSPLIAQIWVTFVLVYNINHRPAVTATISIRELIWIPPSWSHLSLRPSSLSSSSLLTSLSSSSSSLSLFIAARVKPTGKTNKEKRVVIENLDWRIKPSKSLFPPSSSSSTPSSASSLSSSSSSFAHILRLWIEPSSWNGIVGALVWKIWLFHCENKVLGLNVLKVLLWCKNVT